MELFSVLFTLTLFTIVGFNLKQGRKIKFDIVSLLLIMLLFLSVSFIGVETVLIGLDEFKIYLVHSLQGLVLGFFVDYLNAGWKSRKIKKESFATK